MANEVERGGKEEMTTKKEGKGEREAYIDSERENKRKKCMRRVDRAKWRPRRREDLEGMGNCGERRRQSGGKKIKERG